MSNTSRADAVLMEQVAKRFEEVRTDLEGRLNHLKGVVEGVRSDWQGSGGTSFTNVTTAWGERQTDLLRVLQETADGIRAAGHFYAASNDNAARNVMHTFDLTQLGGHHTGGTQ